VRRKHEKKYLLKVLICILLEFHNSMEANNKSPTIQTSGDIGVGKIMELDPGQMENDDDSDSSDPENCTGTMCYDIVPSYLLAGACGFIFVKICQVSAQNEALKHTCNNARAWHICSFSH
jgi:hypothetical protein